MKIDIRVDHDDVFVSVRRTHEPSDEPISFSRALEGIGTAIAHLILESDTARSSYPTFERMADAFSVVSRQTGQVLRRPQATPATVEGEADLSVVDVSGNDD